MSVKTFPDYALSIFAVLVRVLQEVLFYGPLMIVLVLLNLETKNFENFGIALIVLSIALIFVSAQISAWLQSALRPMSLVRGGANAAHALISVLGISVILSLGPLFLLCVPALIVLELSGRLLTRTLARFGMLFYGRDETPAVLTGVSQSRINDFFAQNRNPGEPFDFTGLLLYPIGFALVFGLAIFENEIGKYNTASLIIITFLGVHSSTHILALITAAIDVIRVPSTASGPNSLETNGGAGLSVEELTAWNHAQKQTVIAPLSFSVSRGGILGVCGRGAGGKSLLLSCLANQKPSPDLIARGTVSLDGRTLWGVRSELLPELIAHIPESAFVLPGTAIENICAYERNRDLRKISYILSKIDPSDEFSDELMRTQNAESLSRREKKVLAIARGFYSKAKLLVIDTPERDLSSRQIVSLLDLVKEESRYGRSFIIATESQNILSMCHEVLILENGMCVEYGPAAQINKRYESCKNRIIIERKLSAIKKLEKWVRALYTRNGDDKNRENTCRAAECLLRVSARGNRDESKVRFELTHDVGYSTLSLYDRGELIEAERLEAISHQQERPEENSLDADLWTIQSDFLSFEQSEVDTVTAKRCIKIKVETYDPRKQ